MFFDIGDLVEVSQAKKQGLACSVGIVIDALDMPDGYTKYEVLIDNQFIWFDDYQISEIMKNIESR